MCTHELKDFCPDTDAYGVTLYFLGICYTVLRQWREAERVLGECLQTSWGCTSEHHTSLIYFSRGKLYQCQSRHADAIREFTLSIKEVPDNAYAIFRRGWSYKATEKFDLAGSDFETAKFMKPNDPNFAINYKKISKFEYMEIESEPDRTEVFPPLLPIPGSV